jgi:ribosomal protein S18 acetylase RimI-like enzyme
MKAGSIVESFTAKDGRRIVLRAPKWSDLDDFHEMINSLVREGADVNLDRMVTRENEMEWLDRHLISLEKDSIVSIAAEADGRIVGHVDLHPKAGRQEHVATLGIIVLEGYRDVGIGTELMKEAEKQARKLGLKIIVLDLFSTNDRAFHLYNSMGYNKVGSISKAVSKGTSFVDEIIMAKEI